eukprot:CAMPEP_0119052238 /NCGR_PEP_ID=MMETSP1177-20130426/73607_1 /TAXON_ID=2985 /ORGANISM="Ochromonas sp, Strain CCMP1899" /LENGTH=292 /DNA_ID=CAMNT_0007031743 /DNA_START=1174 /DNA_END=2052 /DNA_ORIENTATION=+
MASLVIKDLTPKVVLMWLNTVSHFRDEMIRDYAGQAKESLIKAMKHENLECELTSQPIDSTEFNHGNEANPGLISNLMLAVQTPVNHHIDSTDINNVEDKSGVDSESMCVEHDAFDLMPIEEDDGEDLVVSLLSQGASVLAFSPDGSTALMYAAEAGNLRNVTLLVKAGSNIEQQRRDGCTALQLAAYLGHNSVVSYLLEIGAFILNNKKGMNALLFAAMNGHLQICLELLAFKPDLLDYKRQDGMSALTLANEQGHTDLANLLVDMGAKVERESGESMGFVNDDLQKWDCY